MAKESSNGGKALLQAHGREYFVKLAKKGVKARRAKARAEELKKEQRREAERARRQARKLAKTA